MATTNCNKECKQYNPVVVKTGPGGQADLALICRQLIIAQVPYIRGRENDYYYSLYQLSEKTNSTICLNPDLRQLI